MRSTRKLLAPLLAVAILGTTTWGFVLVTRQVMDGSLQSWDERILHALRDADEAKSPRGPLWIEHVARDVTALGSMTVIFLMTGAMAGFFFLVRRRRDAVLLCGAIASGMGAFFVLKHFVARERPALVSPLVYSETHSYPSGHVMLAAILYFALAILISRHVTHFRVRAFVWWAAVALSVAIAFSRTYLGIHWPSDVVAALLAGVGWTALWWIVGWAGSWLRDRETKASPDSSRIIPPILMGNADSHTSTPLSLETADGSG
jgi:undecaprenyl-diphosphatase